MRLLDPYYPGNPPLNVEEAVEYLFGRADGDGQLETAQAKTKCLQELFGRLLHMLNEKGFLTDEATLEVLGQHNFRMYP